MKKIIKVTAAILEKDGRIIIAQRKSSDHLSGKWEFPGGKIEPGETPCELWSPDPVVLMVEKRGTRIVLFL